MNNEELKNIEKEVSNQINSIKISAGTIRRTVGMVVNGIVQIAGVALGQDLLVNTGIINNIIGWGALALTAVLVAFQFWCAWKNNDFTKKALIAGKEFEAIKANVNTIAVETVELDKELK